MSTQIEAVTPSLLRRWPLPSPGDSKNSRGQALIIGGSRATPGAAMLAGLAALRVGAGVLRLGVPESVAVVIATAIPECGVTGFIESPSECWSRDGLGQAVEDADAILVGPGLDDIDVSVALLKGALKHARAAPLAFDAFALGALSRQPGTRANGQHPPVLSPNRAEAARLLDVQPDELDDDTNQVAAAIARQWDACVTFQNVVSSPAGQIWDIASGHSGLGTSGSGDVLAGAIVGLLARGAEPSQAAVWGTYAHVTAGDRLASRIGPLGYLARELIDEIPAILAELHS
ncbi:MAG: carbohydrate kinase, YjeF related protein [Frankiales bacterium]|nr:carbohydrate kinase, YjeF related protein [Frankiales bacterium]